MSIFHDYDDDINDSPGHGAVVNGKEDLGEELNGRELDEEEYKGDFSGKEEKALSYALDTRKFEIELYWKRATYFWTFIAAALAAYGVIQASKDIDIEQRRHLSVLISVLGFVFSFAWQAVNSGSKHWQENWENHVAMLEDKVIGPLYKTVSGRPPTTNFKEKISDTLTGPRKYSVSKINQIVSLFVCGIWLLLTLDALRPYRLTTELDWFLFWVVVLGIAAWGVICVYGKSHSFSHRFIARRYQSMIVKSENRAPASEAPADSTPS